MAANSDCLMQRQPSVADNSTRLTRRGVPSRSVLRQQQTFPAWLLSLFLHGGVLALLTVFWTSRPHGTNQDFGGPIGIAVVQQRHGVQEYLLAGESEATDVPSTEIATTDTNTGLPAASDMASSQQEMLRGLIPQLDNGGGSTTAAGDLGLGVGNASLPTGGPAGVVKAKLFGIEGEGSRFVYVIDRSDSMNGFEGKPMQRARAELLESMSTLGPTHQFQVIFYSDTPMPYGGAFGGGPQLLRGDERSKELVQRFIQNTSAIGGTNHVDSLRMALSMAPDIVFFLTDGDYPQPAAQALDDILNRAARAGSTIHCIQFGEGNRTVRSNWISSLSEATGGQYRYVDVSKF
jgi:hypothetical protein